MLAADEIEQVLDGLCFWQRYQPSLKADCSSCAVQTEAGWVLIDPIPLSPDALQSLEAEGKPSSIILTNGNHDRAAAAFRERFSIPIHAHPDAVPELGLKIDGELREGQMLGPLKVIELPGGGRGEIALYDARGRLHIGDALVHLESTGLSLLPDKYCMDHRTLRIAVEKLLRFPFEVLTFAHGLPLVSRARQRLEALLA